jgi:hypothetical protein
MLDDLPIKRCSLKGISQVYRGFTYGREMSQGAGRVSQSPQETLSEIYLQRNVYMTVAVGTP